MEGITTSHKMSRTEGLAQPCRANLHCRTDHPGVKSVAEELGGSELTTSGLHLEIQRPHHKINQTGCLLLNILGGLLHWSAPSSLSEDNNFDFAPYPQKIVLGSLFLCHV